MKNFANFEVWTLELTFVSRGVVFRLVTFAVALALVPLSTFFGTKNYIFNGISLRRFLI